MRSLNRCCVLLAFAIPIAFGCSSASNEEATPLVSEFVSGISLVNWESLADRAKLKWAVVENQTVEAQGERPKFSNTIVSVSAFVDLDEPGEAQFQFLNDRLMAVWFFPRNFETYSAKFLEIRKIQVDQGKIAHVKPGTAIVVGKDFQGRRFVRFEDEKLTDEMNRWISKHSQVPADVWGESTRIHCRTDQV